MWGIPKSRSKTGKHVLNMLKNVISKKNVYILPYTPLIPSAIPAQQTKFPKPRGMPKNGETLIKQIINILT